MWEPSTIVRVHIHGRHKIQFIDMDSLNIYVDWPYEKEQPDDRTVLSMNMNITIVMPKPVIIII